MPDRAARGRAREPRSVGPRPTAEAIRVSRAHRFAARVGRFRLSPATVTGSARAPRWASSAWRKRASPHSSGAPRMPRRSRDVDLARSWWRGRPRRAQPAGAAQSARGRSALAQEQLQGGGAFSVKVTAATRSRGLALEQQRLDASMSTGLAVPARFQPSVSPRENSVARLPRGRTARSSSPPRRRRYEPRRIASLKRGAAPGRLRSEGRLK